MRAKKTGAKGGTRRRESLTNAADAPQQNPDSPTVAARLEQLLDLQGAAARAIAEADTVAAAVPLVLERACALGGFDGGAYFAFDERTRTLRQEARNGTAAYALVLADGDRIPEWLESEPVWTTDIGSAAPQAREPAMSCALVVPIVDSTTIVGVLELGSARPVAPDARLVDVLRGLAVQLKHLHARASVLEQLRESEARFASTMALAAIGISHVDDDGRFLYVNPQLCAMLGYSERELLARTVKEISHPDDVATTEQASRQLREGEITSFKAEKRYVRKDGSSIWAGLTVALKRDRAGRKLYDVSIVEDISARKDAEQRVRYLASHDALTDLPNRAAFTQLLSEACEASRRHGRRLAVLYIDLDRFKLVNDTLGHEAGDELLREVTARLRASVRATDVVARLGGDEFVVLLRDVPNSEIPARVANTIVTSLRLPFSVRGHDCSVSASIGVCLHPDGSQDDQSVLRNADMAMYLAKQSGKNGYRFYVDELRVVAAERAEVESRLREAWEQREYRLEYAAAVTARDGALVALEARVHWNAPELANVGVDLLTSVAAEAGLSAPINLWTLHTACFDAAGWHKSGLANVTLALPVAAAQLSDSGYVAAVRDALATMGMGPGSLELDVPEEALLGSSERIARTLAALDALGVTIAVDAYGTGKASFATLRRYPLRALKLHASRVAGVVSDPERQRDVEGVVALGKALGLAVVATGVATTGDATWLGAAGCSALQGPFAPHALSATECEALLRAR